MRAISILIFGLVLFQSQLIYSKEGDEGMGTSKADGVIHDALYSAYILEYKDFRNKLYKQVWEIKQMKLSDSALTVIKKSYFPLQANAKKWIDDMMNDLLDKKARKSIEENSASFDEKYNTKLQGIIKDYNSNFLKEYNKQAAAQSRLGFEDIIPLAQKVFSWFKQLWGVDKGYLREKYEEPLLIKSWSEVSESDFVE